MVAVHVLAFAVGATVVLGTVLSGLRTFVLPRAAPSILNRLVFVVVGRFFAVLAGRRRSAREREEVLAYHAPLALVVLPALWLGLILVGFTAMFWAVGVRAPREAFFMSGSSLFTLGFARPPGLGAASLSFLEAGLGLGLLALVIAYLPTIYAAFARRETAVALLEVFAGTPPSPRVFLVRHHRIQALDRLDETWLRWQGWFADLEESHTSFGSLSYFRSPQPDRSWVTAAGCVLDSAALTVAGLELERAPEAELMLRSGYVALRRIADYFSIPYDPDPAPDDPISIQREEFAELWEALGAAGLPLKSDQEQAWRDYAGWRVNYDTVLVALAGLTAAPYAPWSSDRAAAFRRPPVTRKVARPPRRTRRR